MTPLYWTIVVAVAVFAADRLLLRLESIGWINYRRNGLSRGGAIYHTLQLSTIFHPAMREIIEVKYEQEQNEDDSGEPPVPDPAAVSD